MVLIPSPMGVYRVSERINIDSVGPLTQSDEYTHIMVIIDCFTRFTELYALRGTGGTEATEALYDYVNRYGNLTEILTDGDSQFNNEQIRELAKKLGAKFDTTKAHSKEENSMVERANKEVVRHLRNFLGPARILVGWHKQIRQVQIIINGAVHHTLGVSPATVLYGGLIDVHKGVITPIPKGKGTKMTSQCQNG